MKRHREIQREEGEECKVVGKYIMRLALVVLHYKIEVKKTTFKGKRYVSIGNLQEFTFQATMR